MKRLIVCLLLLAMMLSLSGCSLLFDFQMPKVTLPELEPTGESTVPTTQPVQVEEEGLQPLALCVGGEFLGEWTDDYIPLAHVSWEDVVLPTADAEKFPALAHALETIRIETAAWAEDTLQMMLPDAEAVADYMGEDFYGFYHETEVIVQRADEKILSLRYETGAYTGGARPYYTIGMRNLDPVTGQVIPLDRVVTDWNRLPKLLEKALLEKYPELEIGAFDDIETMLESYSMEAYCWTMDYQGISFYFGMAEIAPAVAGVLSATLWFDQYPDLFVGDFLDMPPQGYGKGLSPSYETDVDLDRDGTRDSVYVYVDYQGALHIDKNDQTLVNDQVYGYEDGTEAYLVTPDNERFYLYVETGSDNDYNTLWVYDLSGEGIRLVTSLPGEGFAGYWEAEEALSMLLYPVLNDPTGFELATRVDMLGTISGRRGYSMDPETGAPVPKEGYYTLDGENRPPLVTKITVKAKSLPWKRDIEIPAGTQLWFLRTDQESYVDMRMADGTQCRIYVTRQNWQCYVNDLPETECFDGILYAG